MKAAWKDFEGETKIPMLGNGTVEPPETGEPL
jgi:hypothetical protein